MSCLQSVEIPCIIYIIAFISLLGMFYVRNFLSIVLFKNSFNCHIDPEMNTIMTPTLQLGKL